MTAATMKARRIPERPDRSNALAQESEMRRRIDRRARLDTPDALSGVPNRLRSAAIHQGGL